MTRKSVSLLVLVLLAVSLPLMACNRSALNEVPEMEAEAGDNTPIEDAVDEEELDEGELIDEEPTPEVTEEPAEEPTEPVEEPTEEPPAEPTVEPTPEPIVEPTEEPTEEPAPEPEETVAPPAPAPETTTGLRYHVVQPGENLFRIAMRYNTTVEAIARANSITNPALVRAGKRLTIPGAGPIPPDPGAPRGGTVHIVQPGENLFRIALRYNLDYYYLARYNNISNPALIYVGRAIKIPPH